MDSEPKPVRTFQFTIASGLIIVTAVAAVLGLGNYLNDRGGFVLAIPIAVLPFAIAVEFALRESPRQRMTTAPRTICWRLLIVLGCSLLPAIAAWFGMYRQMTWWSPCPLLMILQFAFFEAWFQEWPYAMFLLPWLSFLVLMAPAVFMSDHANLPIRSIVVLVVATLTSVYWFWSGMDTAPKHQSTEYLIGSISSNALLIAILWGTSAIRWRRFNFAGVLAWNLTLTCWLFWLAYPWLGAYI